MFGPWQTVRTWHAASPARNVGPDPAAASHRADASGLIDSAESMVRPALIQHDQLKRWRLHSLKGDRGAKLCVRIEAFGPILHARPRGNIPQTALSNPLGSRSIRRHRCEFDSPTKSRVRGPT